MGKLWQKGYSLNKLMEEFTVGRDFELDQNLVISDCLASSAHGKMLNAIGILTHDEFEDIQKGLREIVKLSSEDNFPITISDEDCHTAIENYLVSHIGDAGKKIHTGRSRNDQVLTCLRIYSRDFLYTFIKESVSLSNLLSEFAKKYELTPMPGRTHMQIAMPSSVGLWAAAFAEEITDSLRMAQSVLGIIDQSPLGSAASYGVPIALDRELTASLMGFGKVQNNVLYVNNSRGKFESLIIDSLDQIVLTLSKMAQDLILFSLPEFGYFSLPAELCSGSSIMPQKKNPDGLELLRAKSASVSAYGIQIKNIIRSLPTGYNRDFQEVKEPFIKGIKLSLQCVRIMQLTISELVVNTDNLEKAFTPEIFATDEAIKMVLSGKNFRDAYRDVGTNLEQVEIMSPLEGIQTRTSTGTAGNLRLDKLEKNLTVLLNDINSQERNAQSALVKLLNIDVKPFT
ncbi:MAG: argininosuccinate lyase [Spirochaetia bacterium]|jgi:argininosuccinate lyase|nr:argininosuccinate lyase [Spirochaetia bacterium]